MEHLVYSRHLSSISDEEDAAVADTNGDDATVLHRNFRCHPTKLRIKYKMLVAALEVLQDLAPAYLRSNYWASFTQLKPH